MKKFPQLIPQKNNAFTFVGRLSPKKGAILFVAAGRNENIKAVFVGSGSVDQKIRELNPNAELLGWQDRAGVIEDFCLSRAIVFPSLCHETPGLVVSEASALGMPSIVSDVCAARDNIIDGVPGLLFRSKNVEDLASKILLLYSDNHLANHLGRTAYNRYWSDTYTYKRHAFELISCYEGVLPLNN